MNFEDDPRCIFSTEISHTDRGHAIELPPEEIELGTVDPNLPVRVVVYQPSVEAESVSPQSGSVETESDTEDDVQQPPVSVGESRSVTIDDEGDQGDGIATVDTGFVLIVPEADVGDSLRVKIKSVQDTFAIAEPVTENTVPDHQMPPYRDK